MCLCLSWGGFACWHKRSSSECTQSLENQTITAQVRSLCSAGVSRALVTGGWQAGRSDWRLLQFTPSSNGPRTSHDVLLTGHQCAEFWGFFAVILRKNWILTRLCVSFYRTRVLCTKANFLIVHGSCCSLTCFFSFSGFDKSSAVVATKRTWKIILNYFCLSVLCQHSVRLQNKWAPGFFAGAPVTSLLHAEAVTGSVFVATCRVPGWEEKVRLAKTTLTSPKSNTKVRPSEECWSCCLLLGKGSGIPWISSSLPWFSRSLCCCLSEMLVLLRQLVQVKSSSGAGRCPAAPGVWLRLLLLQWK